MKRDPAGEVARPGKPDLERHRPRVPLLAVDGERPTRCPTARARGDVDCTDDLVVLDQQRDLPAKLHLDPSARGTDRGHRTGRAQERSNRRRAERAVTRKVGPFLEAEDCSRRLVVRRHRSRPTARESRGRRDAAEARASSASDTRLSAGVTIGRRVSYPGKRPTGTPPSTSIRTETTPGTPRTVRTSCPTRVWSEASSRPAANRAPRSTVTTRRAIGDRPNRCPAWDGRPDPATALGGRRTGEQLLDGGPDRRPAPDNGNGFPVGGEPDLNACSCGRRAAPERRPLPREMPCISRNRDSTSLSSSPTRIGSVRADPQARAGLPPMKREPP